MGWLVRHFLPGWSCTKGWELRARVVYMVKIGDLHPSLPGRGKMGCISITLPAVDSIREDREGPRIHSEGEPHPRMEGDASLL